MELDMEVFIVRWRGRGQGRSSEVRTGTGRAVARVDVKKEEKEEKEEDEDESGRTGAREGPLGSSLFKEQMQIRQKTNPPPSVAINAIGYQPEILADFIAEFLPPKNAFNADILSPNVIRTVPGQLPII
ncbi:unnamed protein product [Nippostrongylus brasiliensis]|uniref:RNA helicase n=1 Tax=Nippostrongylus brasiliensis TaxID=27835 RepID=A0A0N4Y2U9_NIPBR|nr:hypothetical protein Q1695_001833 [Nippostrongylus brasiliensis]VDL73658.1 unnamed protein product [Nippostrongylus brasiliensis]